MKYKCVPVLFCILLCVITYAQDNRERDSLQRLLAVAKTDTEKVNLYINIGKQYAQTDAQRALQYYQRAGALSKQVKYAEGVMLYYAEMNDWFTRKGLLDSALALNFEALKYANKTQDSTSIARAFFNIGIAYTHLEEIEHAVAYCEKGRNLFARLGIVKFEGIVDNTLQYLAYQRHQYRKGVAYGLQAVEKLTLAKDPENLCYAFNNLGLNYIELKQYDSASYFLEKAYQLAIRLNNIEIQTTYNLNIGYINLLQGNFKKMKSFVDKALELSNKQGQPEYAGLALYGLSTYYLSEKEYVEAKRYADSSLAVGKRYNMKKLKLRILPTLSNISFAMQDAKLGFAYLNQYLALNDSVLNESVTKNTISIEKKYETEKKEARILLQQTQIRQKNLLNYLALGGVAALSAVLLMGYRSYRHRQKLQQAKIAELETEKQLLATQSLLQGQEDERSRLAKDLHDGLGGMLSGVKLQLGAMKGNLILTEESGTLFNSALNKLDQSIAEMRRVAHNMMPEALIQLGLAQALQDYADSISTKGMLTVATEFYGLEQRLNATTEVTVYRIVQELVNNAVKHSGAQNILVQVLRRDQLLSITVEDNGSGFDARQWQEKPTAGLQNIQSRVHYLGGNMDIKSEPGKGTSVYVECTIENNG